MGGGPRELEGTCVLQRTDTAGCVNAVSLMLTVNADESVWRGAHSICLLLSALHQGPMPASLECRALSKESLALSCHWAPSVQDPG